MAGATATSRVLTTLLVLHTLWAQVLSAEPEIPALIILGDSTVDVGNNNNLLTIIKSNFSPYGRDFSAGPTGRFCNGKVIADYVAEYIGIPYPPAYLDPNAKGTAILTGINTASAASGYYDKTSDNFNVIPLSKQLDWLKNWQKQVTDQVGPSRATTIFEKGIFVVSTGSNDYVNNYYINPVLQKQYTRPQYNDLLVGLATDFMKDLYNIGARRIAVVNMPPLGCLPSQIVENFGKGKCIDNLNQDASHFNNGFKDAVTSQIEPNLPGVKIVVLDAYSYIFDAFNNPAKYGMSHHNPVDISLLTGVSSLTLRELSCLNNSLKVSCNAKCNDHCKELACQSSRKVIDLCIF